jgi:hypothetical protein
MKMPDGFLVFCAKVNRKIAVTKRKNVLSVVGAVTSDQLTNTIEIIFQEITVIQHEALSNLLDTETKYSRY